LDGPVARRAGWTEAVLADEGDIDGGSGCRWRPDGGEGRGGRTAALDSVGDNISENGVVSGEAWRKTGKEDVAR